MTPYETTLLTTLAQVATAPAPDLHVPNRTVVLSAATPSVQASGVTDYVPFLASVLVFLTTQVSVEDTETQLIYRNDSWNAVVLAVANEPTKPLYRLVRNSQSATSQHGASTFNPQSRPDFVIVMEGGFASPVFAEEKAGNGIQGAVQDITDKFWFGPFFQDCTDGVLGVAFDAKTLQLYQLTDKRQKLIASANLTTDEGKAKALKLAVNVGRWLRHVREQQLVGKWQWRLEGYNRSIELSSKGALKRLPLEPNQVKWMRQVYRSNIPCRESLEGDITKAAGNDQYQMSLSPIGLPLDELLSRGKVPDPVPVLEAILSFFVGLHAIGFVYIDLRPSNVIRANEGYLVIDLEFVRPVNEAVPVNLKCRSVLEKAKFPKMGMTASTCMDLVMLHELMVTCGWTN